MRFYDEDELEAITIQELLTQRRIEMLVSDNEVLIHIQNLRETDITFYIQKNLEYPLALMLFSNRGETLIPNTPIAQITYTVDPFTEVTTRLTHAGARLVPLPKRYDLWNIMAYPGTGQFYFPNNLNWKCSDQGCNSTFELNLNGTTKASAIAKFMI